MDLQAFQLLPSIAMTDMAAKVLATTAFWFMGRWLIGRVIEAMQVAINRNHVDSTLTKYSDSGFSIALNIALVVGILGYVGIQTTSLAAMLAAAGVALGAAWSGLLGYFVAGAYMRVLQPFKTGNFVSIAGIAGWVRELSRFGTAIVTPDSVMTIFGSGKIFRSTIQNPLLPPARPLEQGARPANSVDPLDTIARLRSAVAQIETVSPVMSPEVSSLDMRLEHPLIATQFYKNTDLSWQVYFDTYEAIVKVCREAGWPVTASSQIRLIQPA